MATEQRLARAIGFALTGEWLELAGSVSLADDLASAGFSLERLTDLRAARQESREPWPFPVPLDERRALGFAAFDAALAQARGRLGLTGLAPSRPAERPLDRDEQRLQADRPPHW